MADLIIRNTNNGCCIVNENKEQKDIAMNGKSYLNLLCLEHGSSYEGRAESFCYLTGARQKAAVLVSELTGELWFPLMGVRQKDCIWLNYSRIYRTMVRENVCYVQFINGVKIDVPCDVRVVRQQMNRCREFMEKLQNNALSTHRKGEL